MNSKFENNNGTKTGSSSYKIRSNAAGSTVFRGWMFSPRCPTLQFHSTKLSAEDQYYRRFTGCQATGSTINVLAKPPASSSDWRRPR